MQPLLVQWSPYQDWLEHFQWLQWLPLLDPSAAPLSARNYKNHVNHTVTKYQERTGDQHKMCQVCQKGTC